MFLYVTRPQSPIIHTLWDSVSLGWILEISIFKKVILVFLMLSQIWNHEDALRPSLDQSQCDKADTIFHQVWQVSLYF